MKKNTLLLLICITFGHYSQSQDTPNLPTRQVIPAAVELWKKSFQDLKDDHLIDTTTWLFTDYSCAVLNSLYRCGEFGDSSARTVSFRYYLESNNLPKIALMIPEDSTQFLITDENGARIVPISYFWWNNDKGEPQNKFDDWQEFVNKSNAFVYVKEYRYNWHWIFYAINPERNGQCDCDVNNSNSLRIEHVAHTISPDNQLYEVPGGLKFEGFIALDLLFTKVSTQKGIETSKEYLDFAMPCPRNCPR